MSIAQPMPSTYRTGGSWISGLFKQSYGFYRVVVSAITLCAFGGWLLHSAAGTGEREKVDLRKLEKGYVPQSRSVEIRGNLIWNGCVYEDNSKHADYLYVPVVSSRWRKSDPVAAFVKLGKHEAKKVPSFAVVDGLVAGFGMSYSVERCFTQEEPQFKLATNYILIDYKANPETEKRFGTICLVAGVVLLALGFLFCYHDPRESYLDLSSQLQIDDGPAYGSAEFAKNQLMQSSAYPEASESIEECDDAVKKWCEDRGFNYS